MKNLYRIAYIGLPYNLPIELLRYRIMKTTTTTTTTTTLTLTLMNHGLEKARNLLLTLFL